MSQQYFRVNAPGIVHEIIDGEAVVIDLERGNYYSLERAAADVWKWLDAGASVGDIAAGLAERYQCDHDVIDATLPSFVSELEAEGLIAPLVNVDAAPAVSLVGVTTDAHLPFDAPRVSKFTDMQDLLLLDPIHEVDASGWPRPKPE